MPEATSALAKGGKTQGDWVADLFREFDSRDPSRLAACFAENVEVRFGNQPTLNGRAAAVAGIGAFWSTIDGMSHERVELIADGDVACQISSVTYTRKDGVVVIVPAATYVRRDGRGQLDRLWVYIDLAPLFS